MMFFYKKFGRNNESVYICNHIFNECSHFGRGNMVFWRVWEKSNEHCKTLKTKRLL